jgi:hypothetical protein
VLRHDVLRERLFDLAGTPGSRAATRAVAFADGLLVARTDFGWEEHRLVGEFDGRVKYGRLLRPGQDPGDVVIEEKRREDAVRDEGWRMVRWVWADLSSGHRLAARVRRARERGRR